MTKTNILEAKTRLSEFIERASRGERIVICRHNAPVAELRALERTRTTPRPIGPLPGRPAFEVPSTFFDPIDEEELSMWDGVRPSDPLSSAWKVQPPKQAAKTGRSKAKVASRPAHRQTRRRS